jgi:hypothetical protein
MNLVRVTSYFLVSQCMLAAAAFAGAPPVSTPEPATLALLAVGAGGLVVARKLRKRK